MSEENDDWQAMEIDELPTSLGEEMKGKIVLDQVGADVEHFLVDGEGRGVSAIGLIGGSKKSPRAILGGGGFAVQEDNVALEYNIPPAKDQWRFVYNLMRINDELERMCRDDLGLGRAIVPSMKFDAKQLAHPLAKRAGCDPDVCVWTRDYNPTVKLDEVMRAAGGHVHISFLIGDKKPEFPADLTEVESLIMALDIFLAVPATLIDKDRDRRKMYGKAGAFRLKPEYGGVEYRTLSNFWTQEPKYMGWVFQQVERAINYVNNNGPMAHAKLSQYKDVIAKAVNDGCAQTASRLTMDYNIKIPA